jgi:Flp pilus assembly protein CpaB
VQVLVTVSDKTRGEARARLVLDGASVFAVGREQSISGSMGVDADGFARGTITTVTLAVTRDEARQLAEARRTGELDILLMPRTAQAPQP